MSTADLAESTADTWFSCASHRWQVMQADQRLPATLRRRYMSEACRHLGPRAARDDTHYNKFRSGPSFRMPKSPQRLVHGLDARSLRWQESAQLAPEMTLHSAGAYRRRHFEVCVFHCAQCALLGTRGCCARRPHVGRKLELPRSVAVTPCMEPEAS